MFDAIFSLSSNQPRWVCVDDDGEPIYCGNFAVDKAVAIFI